MSEAPQTPAIPGLSIARNVHYVLSEDPENPLPIEDRHRAAIITKVLDPRVGMIEVCVFMQLQDDLDPSNPRPMRQEVAFYSEIPYAGTWHFPEYVK